MLLCLLCAACSNPARQADDAVARAVKQALYDETAVNLLQVDVAVERGRVYLSGEVDLYAYKERAEELARAIEGVEDVVSRVQVQP
ncbi:MAG TPA: BON domain-containing protein [Nitrospiraceae bacterium]|nr:BON domain-containing protein [Nitrospiraceae bacterium]